MNREITFTETGTLDEVWLAPITQRCDEPNCENQPDGLRDYCHDHGMFPGGA